MLPFRAIYCCLDGDPPRPTWFNHCEALCVLYCSLIFGSNVFVAALMTESHPVSASIPLNADGVYLATFSALSLNFKLHLQGYYNSEEKSVPITEVGNSMEVVA